MGSSVVAVSGWSLDKHLLELLTSFQQHGTGKTDYPYLSPKYDTRLSSLIHAYPN